MNRRSEAGRPFPAWWRARPLASAGRFAIGLAILVVPLAAGAQERAQCPRLAAGSALQWQEVRNPDLLFCKALDADGAQLFSVMLSRESPFEPIRRLRAEATRVNGRETWWYRTEIANRPDLQTREAAIELGDGRIAYFNVQADGSEALQRAYTQIAGLVF